MNKETGDEIVSDEWKLQHHVWDESAHSIEHPSQAQPGVQAFPRQAARGKQCWRIHCAGTRAIWNYWMFEHECAARGRSFTRLRWLFGERQFEVTQAANPRHLQLRDGAMKSGTRRTR